MHINMHRYDKYIIVEVKDSNTTIDLGILNEAEAESLMNTLENAVEEIEQYLKNL